MANDEHVRRAIKQLHALKRQGKPMRLAADLWRKRWQTLVAIILSARTRDEVTIVVGESLFAKYPSLDELAHAKLSALERVIHPVNFFRNKSNSVRACARELIERHSGRVPSSVDELVELSGVGRKTANVYLAQYGASAIGVDTHVTYISRALAWTRHRAPVKIERDLEKLFPKHMWRRVNSICVHFGKTHMSRRKKDVLLADISSSI